MNLFYVLFSKHDCFLCEFYEWVKSLFVYEAPPSGPRVEVVTHTSPAEHFALFHPFLLFFTFAVLVTIITVILYLRHKRNAPLPSALRSEIGGTSSAPQPSFRPIHVKLYGFKEVSIEPGKEYYPDIPTRDGYAFTGWFYDPSFTKPFMPGKKLKKDITLYPR